MRHRPPHIVEDSSSVGPEASYGLDWRLVGGKRPLSAHELIIGLSSSFFAMAGGAFCCIHSFPLLRGSAARRQADAVWTNADVPRRNFLRRCHSSEIWTFSRECNG